MKKQFLITLLIGLLLVGCCTSCGNKSKVTTDIEVTDIIPTDVQPNDTLWLDWSDVTLECSYISNNTTQVVFIYQDNPWVVTEADAVNWINKEGLPCIVAPKDVWKDRYMTTVL
jgi:hypothetical protein